MCSTTSSQPSQRSALLQVFCWSQSLQPGASRHPRLEQTQGARPPVMPREEPPTPAAAAGLPPRIPRLRRPFSPGAVGHGTRQRRAPAAPPSPARSRPARPRHREAAQGFGALPPPPGSRSRSGAAALRPSPATVPSRANCSSVLSPARPQGWGRPGHPAPRSHRAAEGGARPSSARALSGSSSSRRRSCRQSLSRGPARPPRAPYSPRGGGTVWAWRRSLSPCSPC